MDSFTFIDRKGFNTFLRELSKAYTVVAPYGEEDYLLRRFTGDFTFNAYRATTSLRQFFLPAQEHIDTYFEAGTSTRKPFCFVGAKNCDLASLAVQDHVFLQGDVDEEYKWLRDNNIIISSDCTSFKDVCFCLALDITPYPQKSFDLNISPSGTGFLVEVGSVKGEQLIKEHACLFQSSSSAGVEYRAAARKKVTDELSRRLKEQNLPAKSTLYDLIKKGYGASVWKDEATRCVECGACIMNCPTCHCFLLFDSKRDDRFLRGRIWDGCQYQNFSRVGGGANPLRLRSQRLRNRYIKKFEFFPDTLGAYACTGCGRCVECCPGRIDLREVFRQLAAPIPLDKKEKGI